LYVGGGSVQLTSDTLTANLAVGGLGGYDGVPSIYEVGGSGGGGAGGGLYVGGGTVQLTGDTLQANRASGGGGGPGHGSQNGGPGTGGNGGDAGGGGLFVGGGSVQLSLDTLSGNSAVGGAFGPVVSGPPKGSNGLAGNARGGGVAVTGGTVQLGSSQVTGNHATGANTSRSGFFFQGNAQGGGLYVGGGSVAVSGSTLSGNVATGGSGPYVGGTGYGGGLALAGGSALLVNDTIASNEAVGGTVVFVSGGLGGGVADLGGALRLVNVTIASNRAGGVDGVGGGLYDATGQSQLANTILAYDSAATGPDEDGALGSSDHDLISDAADSSGFGNPGSGDLVNFDPALEALGFYGGPTQTFALAAGSPAINAGDAAVAAATDQRGFARIVGQSVDIGADEAGATPATSDLAVRVTGPTEVIAGDNYSVTVTVTNVGRADQSNVTLTVNLPAQITVLAFGVTGSSAWTYSTGATGSTSSAVAWSPALAAGASATFTLYLSVSGNAPAGTVLSPTFAVGPTANDPKPANNSAAWATTVIAAPTVLSSLVQVNAGSITYDATTHHYVQTIALTNISAGPLNGPIAFVLTPATGSSFTLTNASGILETTPYVSLVHQGKTWKAKQTITIKLDFTAAGTADISYSWAVEEGVGT
jgi:hypothetical protein